MEDDDRFHYMGGGIKSPQDTVVHPMYVSYNSLPTSAGTLLRSQQRKASTTNAPLAATLGRSTIECHKNFVTFNGNENLLRSSHSHPTSLRAASMKSSGSILKGVAEETTPTDEFPNYLPPTPIAPRTTSFDSSSPEQRKLPVGEVSFYTGSEPVDDLIDLQPHKSPVGRRKFSSGSHNTSGFNPEYASFHRPNILANQRLLNEGFYKNTSVDYIPRSPNLSSIGNRKRAHNVPRRVNNCDQVRVGPAWGASQVTSDSQGMNIRSGSQSQLPINSNSYSRGPIGQPNAFNATTQEALHGRGDGVEIAQKMGPMLGQKKSLRPRSYCSSSYYNEYEEAPGFVHTPN